VKSKLTGAATSTSPRTPLSLKLKPQLRGCSPETDSHLGCSVSPLNRTMPRLVHDRAPRETDAPRNYSCLRSAFIRWLDAIRNLPTRLNGEKHLKRSRRSENSEPPECLLNRRDLFCRAWILFGRGPRCYETKLLFAVQKPRALGHETVLARDPFLDLLVGGALTGWLLLADTVRRALTSSIVIASGHAALRLE